MKLNCYIIKHLKANYIEGLTSDNINEVSYFKKYSKQIKIAISISIIFLIIIIGLIIGIFSLIFSESKETITNISEYERILGKDGKYKNNYIAYNNIFPNQIPASAEIEDFYYEYYNPWDANYLGYLVYTCNDEDFEAEYNRLKDISSHDNFLIYGATDFNYELCAVYANEYCGYIYALADKNNNRFIYVDLEFCNYFTDIDYEKIIDAKYLPEGFDATKGNETRKEFDESH